MLSTTPSGVRGADGISAPRMSQCRGADMAVSHAPYAMRDVHGRPVVKFG